MKNKQLENLKRLAKLNYLNNVAPSSVAGLSASSVVFDERIAHRSWHEEVWCAHSNYRLAIRWRHPRYEFFRALHLEINARVIPESVISEDRQSLLGKSFDKSPRKRAWFYLIPPGDNREEICSEILKEDKLQIGASFRSQWLPYARVVTICAPVEVRNQGELTNLIDIVKSLAKHSTTLDQLFPGYRYTAEDWRVDCDFSRDERHAPLGML